MIEERLKRLEAIELYKGNHPRPDNGPVGCAMEIVSWVVGEDWTDHPECACPVISSFMREWNDSLPDDKRTDLLRPLIPRLVGTRSTDEVAERRSYMALDWLIRVHTPAWLDLHPDLKQHAAALRDMEAIADMAGATAAGEKVRAARDAARAAARAAAGAAAGAAVWDAAWDAAGAAAWDAARAAARAAAWDALAPTRDWLQQSALQLIDQMLAVEPTDAAA